MSSYSNCLISINRNSRSVAATKRSFCWQSPTSRPVSVSFDSSKSFTQVLRQTKTEFFTEPLLKSKIFNHRGSWISQTYRAMGPSSSSFSTKVSTLPLSSSLPPKKEASDRNTKRNDNKSSTSSQKITDIEDLHQTALLSGSDTYIDPSTGFTVFTELVHLKRGKCCGSMCRHCPYGWENVRRNESVSSGQRKAKLRSGDVAMASELMNKIKFPSTKTTTMVSNIKNETTKSKLSASSPPEKTSCAPRMGKGGRHGGRHTKKNVPYTRHGDKGLSQLLTGEKRKKNDDSFEAMGTVDELCSIVGTVHAELLFVVDTTSSTNSCKNMDFPSKKSSTYGNLSDWLLEVMSRLFDVGSHVANPRKKKEEESIVECDNDEDESGSDNDTNDGFNYDGIGGGFDPGHIDDLEDWIDEMTDILPELGSFILPTGSKASAHLHVARTVCRRAERRTVSLVEDGVCDPNVLRYLNRLSDFFFTAARWTNYCEGREEIQYRRPYRGAKQRSRVKVNLDQK